MSSIFVKAGNDLTELTERPYDAESILQQLLEDHPGLISGATEAADGENGLLLVQREMGVEDSQDGAGRWSLDHLFLDSNGVPTLVEVKRSTDTRIRREVVGQMLDYAANAATFWGLERIRSSFAARCISEGQDQEEVLKGFLGVEDPDEFWESVNSNLRSARMRLVFVADRIPSELKRIVEFLNGQMTRTDVLAIEVKQFGSRDSDLTTLVPVVVGMTEAAKDVKKASSGAAATRWTEAEFRDAWSSYKDQALGKRVLSLYESALSLGPKVTWGKAAFPSVSLRFNADSETPVSVSFYEEGFAINFDFVRGIRSGEEMYRLADLARQLEGVATYIEGVENVNWGMHRAMKWEHVLASDESVEGFISFFKVASSPSEDDLQRG